MQSLQFLSSRADRFLYKLLLAFDYPSHGNIFHLSFLQPALILFHPDQRGLIACEFRTVSVPGKAVKIPIIGIGGVTTWKDAIEFFLAGASAVQTGTVNFVQPSAAIEIIEGIRTYCSSNKIRDVGELVGALDAPSNVSVVESWL